jgi:hypothetical protein
VRGRADPGARTRAGAFGIGGGAGAAGDLSRGLADHAYLSLCAQLGDPSLARAVAPGLRSFSRDPRAYAQLREQLAARIEALLSERKLGAR